MKPSLIQDLGTVAECIDCAATLLAALDRLAESLGREQSYFIKIAAIHALECRDLLNEALGAKPEAPA